MGLFHGHIDTTESRSIVITDVRHLKFLVCYVCTAWLACLAAIIICDLMRLQAFALPVEGTETTAMADDPRVLAYMVKLSDTLELVRNRSRNGLLGKAVPNFSVARMTKVHLQTRKENFIGWYHSHPFDVGPHSNAFLSSTDVSTQLSWQLNEDRAGNPWTSLVVRCQCSLVNYRTAAYTIVSPRAHHTCQFWCADRSVAWIG
jgi:hypothetical protein